MKASHTARDIALLCGVALANFRSTGFLHAGQAWYDENGTVLLTNTNNMFWSYEGTDGGILGHFDPSVQSIVTSATRTPCGLSASW